VRRRAERSVPDVNHLFDGASVDAVLWPTALQRAELFGHSVAEGAPRIAGFAQSRAIDAFGILCWAFGDSLIAMLEAEVDAMADDAAALDNDERAERESALLAKILEMERVEEAIIEAGGDQAKRRPDADPRAVLGLSSDLPPPRER
jgi:hypothetical protein